MKAHLKLRGRIIEKYSTYADFAKHIGMSPSYVTLKLNGKNPFTDTDIEVWGKALDIPASKSKAYFFGN